MTNILFILKLFVSSSSFERISPISRCLNLPLRVKLFGWTTRFSIFNEIAIHDKDRHGEKPICRVSIRASVLQRKIYGRGLKPFAIFFFFFPSLLSATQPRFTENDGSVRERQRRMEKWHGTTEECTGRVIFTGRKWSNSPPRLHFIPLLPFSLCDVSTRG